MILHTKESTNKILNQHCLGALENIYISVLLLYILIVIQNTKYFACAIILAKAIR